MKVRVQPDATFLLREHREGKVADATFGDDEVDGPGVLQDLARAVLPRHAVEGQHSAQIQDRRRSLLENKAAEEVSVVELRLELNARDHHFKVGVPQVVDGEEKLEGPRVAIRSRGM